MEAAAVMNHFTVAAVADNGENDNDNDDDAGDLFVIFVIVRLCFYGAGAGMFGSLGSRWLIDS